MKVGVLSQLPPRAIAARMLARILRGKGSLNDSLPEADRLLTDPRDRGLVRVLLYAALRSFYRRCAALQCLLKRPLPASAVEVEALLLLGLTQLDEAIDTDYAVIDTSVNAVRALGQPQFSSLVNAVLRSAQREGKNLYRQIPERDSIRFNHPDWLIAKLRADWSYQAEAILDANNLPATLWLRVNRQRTTRDALLARLREVKFAADPHPYLSDAIKLEGAGDVTQIPGWEEGWFSVQDIAAQLAVELLDLKPELSVLDACSAPGGKLAHIAEREPGLSLLIGLDSDGKRVERTRSALSRLGLNPKLKHADAAEPQQWWQGQVFDRILIDAPCTGTGVIRRHADIRLLRRESDVEALCKQQTRLLEALWPLLAPQAKLVYVTCSVLKDENEFQIAAFLQRHKDARANASVPEWFGQASGHGRQNFPGKGDADGFFYAVLERVY